jgi:hypothetical protein
VIFIFTRDTMNCTKRRPYNEDKLSHRLKKKVYHKDIEYFGKIEDWPNGVLYHYICKNCGQSVITEGEELL